MMRVLAGDIGGTKTALGLFEGRDAKSLSLVRRASAKSGEQVGLLPIVETFLAGTRVDAAGFGIAGPVQHGFCRATHLPWEVSAAELADALGLTQVALLNDVAVAVLGIPALDPTQVAWLQEGSLEPGGTVTLVTVGTGFGRATLPAGGVPLASEGGHASFAARSETELQLVRWLLAGEPHVAVEHILSGNGLTRLYRFLTHQQLCTTQLRTEALLATEDDPNAVIARLGLADEDPACSAAVAWFAELLGAELGNVALAAIPQGGLYLWGGVALALREALEEPALRDAFLDKDLMRPLLETIPLGLIVEPDLALIGAREAALR